MSSERAWKNAHPSRTHLERQQTLKRKRLGMLEKKKDYKRRAKDYHGKEDELRRLQERASFRNKDEFYFRMQKLKKKDGALQQLKDPKKFTSEEIDQMKTEDMMYLTYKLTQEKQVGSRGSEYVPNK